MHTLWNRTCTAAIVTMFAAMCALAQTETDQPDTDQQNPGSASMDPLADTPSSDFEIQRPPGSGRLVGTWDFEDAITPDGIIVPFPIGWVSGNPAAPLPPRDGFPPWNEPGYTREAAASGTYAFALPTRGGSVSASLASGLLPAIPGAQYLVTARIRTDGADYAAARVRARYARTYVIEQPRQDSVPDEFRDPPPPAQFEIIKSSEVVSPLLQTRERWATVRLTIEPHPEAQFIELDLELLQPAQQPMGERREDHQLTLEDVDAIAYFDDIKIYQVPTVSFMPTKTLGLFQRSEIPGITIAVRDLTGEPLRAELTAFDAKGRAVDTLDVQSTRLSQPFVWEPTLERYGWYRVALELYSEDQRIASEAIDMVWLSTDALAEPMDASFGITLIDPDDQTLAAIPDLAKALGISAVSMPAWGVIERTPERPAVFADVVDQLLDRGVQLTLGLDRIPAALAHERSLDPEDVLTLLAQPDPSWVDAIEPVLTRFGERVVRWRVGAPGDSHAAALENPAETLSGLHNTLSFLIPRGELALPWPATITPPKLEVSPGSLTGTLDGFVVSLPDGASPEMIDVASKTNPVASRSSLHIQLDNDARFHRADRARRVAALLAHAWASDFMTTDISAPIDTRGSRVEPRADAGILSTYANRIGPSRFTGMLDVGEGVTAMIGRAPDATGVLVVWRTSSSEYQIDTLSHLVAFDGTPIAIDPFGNETPLLPGDNGGFELPITQTPTIITGLDYNALQFRAQTQMTPRVLAARAMRNDAELSLTNTWGGTVSGTIRFVHPDSWRVQPEVVPVLLGDGESMTVPLSLTFGMNTTSGVAPVSMRVDLQTQDDAPSFEMPIMLDVGLDPLVVRATYEPAMSNGVSTGDLNVHVIVENRGTDDTARLEAYLRVPGYPTMQAPLGVPPGESLRARFTLERGMERAWGKVIRFGVIEQNGTARLNKERVIE